MLSLRQTPKLEKRLAALEAIFLHIEDLEDSYITLKRLRKKSPRRSLEALEKEYL